ncbi:MAG: ribonuclease D [bacterium]
MQEYFIDTPEALENFCGLIRDSEWLALDTEFIREKTYFPQLCLIQIGNGEVAACVDPLALEDLSPLLEILFDGRIVKVFHAARQDLEIFFHDWQQFPLPLFDTQPAAALLGYGDQIGYGRLVKETLDIDLPKDHSRTDWSRRPLDDAQLRYALDDVVYLGEVYQQMRGKLSKLDRLQWLVDDFAELANPVIYNPNPMDLWKRVKGRQQVHGKKLAVLQQLTAWREQQAVAKNLPKKWILKDEVMIDIAKRLPKNSGQLSKIRGMEPGSVRKIGDKLIALVQDGLNLPREDWPIEKFPVHTMSTQQQAMTDILSAALRLIGEQQQLSPSAIATRKQLEQIVRQDPDCELLKGWRKSVAGNTLVEIAKGERQVTYAKGQLVIS